MPDSFQKWARDGRLATAALVIVFLTWLAFQIFAEPVDRPTALEQTFYTVLMWWLTNIGLVVLKPNGDKEKDKPKDEETVEK